MSRARHHEKKRAMGGKTKPVWNAGGEQNAAKESEELKHGGRAEHMHAEGEHSKHRADRRARGGKVEHHKEHERASGGVVQRARGGHVKHHGTIHHEHEGTVEHHHRARGGRLRGEGVGADKTPLTTASRIKMVTKGEIGEDAEKSD